MLKRKIRVKVVSKIKKYILLSLFIALVLTFSVSLGRYVYRKSLDLYFMTKNFYFESDKLKNPEATYSLNYWNGVDSYDIPININSFKNDLLKSTSDIPYNMTYDCPNTVICSFSKTSGSVSKTTNTDSLTFTMTPTAIFSDGDSVTAKIYATSTSPYVKRLSASFTLVVGKYGLSHEISDKEGDHYLTLKVTNTLDSYVVKEAFDSYNPGNHISKTTYDGLSDEKKAKCASAVIHVSFSPNILRVDNTSTKYMNAYDIQTQIISGHRYVKSFTFDMDPSISSTIKFYKLDKTVDYSNADILTVTYTY